VKPLAVGLVLITGLGKMAFAGPLDWSETIAGKMAMADPPDWTETTVWQGRETRVVKGEIILKFRSGTARTSRQGFFRQHNLRELGYQKFIDVHLIAIPAGQTLEQVLVALNKNPLIEYAEPNIHFSASVFPVPDDPIYQDEVIPGNGLFGVVTTETDRAWNDPDLVDSKGKTTTVVAVLDTGIWYPHEDFAIGGGDTRIFVSPAGQGPVLGPGKIVGWDFANNDNNPIDDHGHGTHVAGTIGATANNTAGIAGVGWFPRLMPVKVLAANGSGSGWWIIGGLGFAKDHGAHVVNMSLGSPSPSSAIWAAVKAVAAEGIVIVAATGNDTSFVGWPAAYPECIAVGAVGKDDTWAYFSNFGPEIDVTAPGTGVPYPQILSTKMGGGYVSYQGTSMATPHAAGLVALVLGQNSDWTPETVYRRFRDTADKVPPPYATTYDAQGWNTYMGYGRINSYHALGGIATTPDYDATVYLRDSRTVLSDPAGANPVDRHVMLPYTAGTVSFSVVSDDRDVVSITNAVVKITNPDMTVTTVPLAAAPIDSRRADYTAVVAAPVEFSESTYIPTAVFTDNDGRETRIPLPAYTISESVPEEPPPSIEPNALEVDLSFVPGAILVGQTSQARLRVTNIGSTTMEVLTPELEINSGASLVSLATGPAPASVAVLAPASTTVFVWTWNASGAGLVDFTGTVMGTEMSSGATIVDADTGQLAIYAAGLAGCPPEVAWSRTYTSAGSNMDQATDVAIDASGNIYVCGWATVPSQGWDLLLRKYDPNGGLIWSQMYNGPASGQDYAASIVIDGNGDLVVGGKTGFDFLIQKYDPDGTLLWNRTYNGAFSGNDFVLDVAVDSFDNVIVVGREQYSGLGNRWTIRKYNSGGGFLWMQTYNNPAMRFDTPRGVAVDSADNIIVVGDEEVSINNYDWLIRTYDSAGNFLWSKSYSGPGPAAGAFDIEMDSLGNFLVCGYERYSGSGYRWITRKYDSVGNVLWSRTATSPAKGTEWARGLAVDGSDGALVGGVRHARGPERGPQLEYLALRCDGSDCLVGHIQ